ncbi:hypothetical protein [Aestuariivita boseongensis]|uniref:hypothetical protein n=1 Tax=Aestuariivita boseongensis TaxID=1470562 RepID=UPI000682E84A|nr:hypothetical protein [Aestuariivita boseongensis]
MDGYSRLVAFLKVLLPLTALGLLSTLFLLSRSVDPTTTLPFGEAEISERLREGLITAPYFSGTTSGGDQIIITASTAKPESETALAQAADLKAQITLSSGNNVTLEALTGSFDPNGDIARFIGDVQIQTTNGYSLITDALESRIKELDLRSDGPVSGQAPFGTLEAGQMQLSANSEGDDAHLLFKDGVKLIYDPKDVEDRP